MVGLIERQGNDVRYERRGSGNDSLRTARRQACPAGLRRTDLSPISLCRMPIRPGPIENWCRPVRGSVGVTTRSIARVTRWVCLSGTSVRHGSYPDVKHHTILLGPRYKELVTDIFKHRVLADNFSLYLHRPTATDPSLAPEGCDAFYVLSPVPHLDAGIDWSTKAEEYRRSIAKVLDSVALPGFQDHIVTSRVMTPQDFHDRLLSHKGAAFSFEPLFTQSAWFRPHNKSEDLSNGLFILSVPERTQALACSRRSLLCENPR